MPTREQLILSAIEKDRPGLVAELSGYIAERGCNVEDSRVAVLGGYAGLFFLISGDETRIASVEHDLDRLEREAGIRAVVRRLESARPTPATTVSPPLYVVTASAIDHEGIIYAITDVVRGQGANILELETSTESAPMSGSPLFSLRMTIALPDSPERLRSALQQLSRTEAVDLDLTPADSAPLPTLRLV